MKRSCEINDVEDERWQPYQWCGELYPEECLRDEVDLGLLCDWCIAAIADDDCKRRRGEFDTTKTDSLGSKTWAVKLRNEKIKKSILMHLTGSKTVIE